MVGKVLSEFTTAKEISAMLQINRRSLVRWVEAGRFPAPHRFGHLLRWKRAEVTAWIAAQGPKEVS